jgi:protein-disulfide isomerase
MAKAAEAANRQGKFKEMNDELFKLSGETSEPTEDSMITMAKKLGLDTDKFKADIGSAQIQALVNKDNADAQDLNLQGTPSAYLNGKYVENIAQIDVMIKETLGK